MTYVMPQGEMVSGDRFVLGYFNDSDSQMYVICDIPGEEGNYILQQATNIVGGNVTFDNNTASRMVVFSMDGTQDSLKCTQVVPAAPLGSGISANTSGDDLLAEKGQASTLSISQDLYANWGSPIIALAGVPYSFNIGGQTLLFQDSDQTFNIDNLIIIPISYYDNCSRTGCAYITNASQTVLMTYCTVTNTAATGVCTNVPPNGWTTISDATSAHSYQYCPVGSTCQTNCKGACTQENHNCTWNNNTQSFACTLPGGLSALGAFWTSTWFLALIIGIGAIIIIIILVLIFYRFESKKKKKSDSGYNIVSAIDN